MYIYSLTGTVKDSITVNDLVLHQTAIALLYLYCVHIELLIIIKAL